MNGYLRQSTASQSVAIGPFIDDTDFKTPKTGLTIANTDIKLIANGGSSASKNSGGATHRVNGVYGITLDATDTATVGELEISVSVSSALIVFCTYVVLEEAVYDALFASSAPGYLQPTTAGRTLDVSAGGEAGVDWGNVGSPTTTNNLSGTTVKAVTDAVTVGTNNDKTGYAIGTGGIAAAAFAAGAIDASAIAANAIGSSELAQTACDKVADSLLARNINGGSSTGRIVKEALKGLRNRVDGSTGTLIVYEEDDTTQSWTGTLTRSAVDPIVEINPS